MPGLIESASAILSASERKLETISNNVSNASSAGFKRQIAFSDALDSAVEARDAEVHNYSDLSQGKLTNTGNPLDLAISGAGLFEVRSGDETFYTRQGHFRTTAEGLVVTPQGHVLQQSGGGDLVLDGAAVEILEDGTVLDDGRPIGRIALLEPTERAQLRPLGGSLFAAPDDAMTAAQASLLRQGMIETSNVALGEEMVAMMAAVREAESGSRLVQTYDELIGRAISTLGQGGR